MMLALTIGLLIGGAAFLMLQRDRFKVILGFVLLSHGVNLLLFASGGTDRREEPLGSDLDPAVTADPLPQAFVLTAIVISFSITIYLLVLAVTGRADPPEDDHGTPYPPQGSDRDADLGPAHLTDSVDPYAENTSSDHAEDPPPAHSTEGGAR